MLRLQASLLIMLLFVGCAERQPPKFVAEIDTLKVNGEFESMTVTLSDENQSTSSPLSINLQNRDEVDSLIDQLTTVLKDLENVKMQMPFDEVSKARPLESVDSNLVDELFE